MSSSNISSEVQNPGYRINRVVVREAVACPPRAGEGLARSHLHRLLSLLCLLKSDLNIMKKWKKPTRWKRDVCIQAL